MPKRLCKANGMMPLPDVLQYLLALVGKYDIRSQEKPKYIFELGCIFGLEFSDVIVGHDSTPLAAELIGEFISGLKTHNSRVRNIGGVTSPLLHFAVKSLRPTGAILLTASHNADIHDRWWGMKIIRGNGIPICGLEIKKIIENRINVQPVADNQKEEYISNQELIDQYISSLGSMPDIAATWFSNNPVIKSILHGLGVQEVYNNTQYRELKYPIGIGLDCDADRLYVFDSKGRQIESDILILNFATDMIARGKRRIILDYQISRAVAGEMKMMGADIIYSTPGHPTMRALMQQLDADFAGEVSGHMYFKGKGDDGIFAAIKFLEIYSKSKVNLQYDLQCSKLLRIYTGQYTETIIAHLAKASSAMFDGIIVKHRGCEISIRKSGTEDMIVLRAYGTESDYAIRDMHNLIQHHLTVG